MASRVVVMGGCVTLPQRVVTPRGCIKLPQRVTVALGNNIFAQMLLFGKLHVHTGVVVRAHILKIRGAL